MSVCLFVCEENISTNNKQILTNVCANTLVPWSIDQRLTITVFFLLILIRIGLNPGLNIGYILGSAFGTEQGYNYSYLR